jgi:hypothetical protein
VIDLATYLLLAAGALIGAGLCLLGIAGVLWLMIKLSEG